MPDLFVIEAPGKAKHILEILKSVGLDARVQATKGHIYSMPDRLTPVGIDSGFREFERKLREPEIGQRIRDEALVLDNRQQIVATQGHEDAGFNSFFRTGWRRFHLKWYGNDLVSAQQLCPYTVGLLRQIPSVKAAMFASLPPGAKLVAHRDPYAGSMRYHLGLAVPEDPRCAIYVDGQSYVWRNGEGIIFDETFIHYAENATGQRRIVLFCDVRRPLRFAPVRWLEAIFARVVMGAAVSKNTDEDRVGFINKLFSKLYKIREIGKAIKRRSRLSYYALKYVIFGALIYWVFF